MERQWGHLKELGSCGSLVLNLQYAILITDYRQHGKSKGKINLKNFYSDAQAVYDALKTSYPENKINLVGYSLGGRIAAHLAATNNPRMTVLIDPASTTGDFSEALYGYLPSTNEFLFQTKADLQKAPALVIIIGPDNFQSLSHQLKGLLKRQDAFYTVPGATHETILGHLENEKIITTWLK